MLLRMILYSAPWHYSKGQGQGLQCRSHSFWACLLQPCGQSSKQEIRCAKMLIVETPISPPEMLDGIMGGSPSYHRWTL